LRRASIITAAIVVALWAAPSAGAKGTVEKLEVCGLDGQCASVLLGSLKGPHGLDIMLAGTPRTTPADTTPYYRLRAESADGITVLLFYVRGGLATSGPENGWFQFRPAVIAALDRAAAPMMPFHDGGPVRVTVDGRPANDPAPYRALLRELPPAAVTDDQIDRSTVVRLTIENAAVSPWTGGRYHFALYDPVHHVAKVSGSPWLSVPAAVRAAVLRDARVGAPVRTTGGNVPALAVPTALIAVLGVAGLAALVVRRRRDERPFFVKEES
jgi:MYXO-CTERM domain-containing protein